MPAKQPTIRKKEGGSGLSSALVNASIQELVAIVTNFAESFTTQSKALRQLKIAFHAKDVVLPEAESLLNEVIHPLMSRLFSMDEEDKGHGFMILSILEKCSVGLSLHGTSVDALLRTRLLSIVQDDLDLNLSNSTPGVIKEHVRIIRVIESISDSSIGRQVIWADPVPIILVLLGWLKDDYKGAVEHHVAAGSALYMEACHSELHTLITIMTKSDSQTFANSKTFIHEMFFLSLDICLSSIFLPETRHLAGLLSCHLLTLGDMPDIKSWAPIMHSIMEQEVPASISHDMFLSELYRRLSTHREDLGFFMGGILQSHEAKHLFEANDSTPLLFHLFDWIFVLISESQETRSQISAMHTMARWLHFAKNVMADKKKNIPSEYKSSLDEFVQSSRLNTRIVSFVIDRWEDVLDVINHKVRDIFESLLNLLEFLNNGPLYLETLVNGLLEEDRSRKAKYDLLGILIRHGKGVDKIANVPGIWTDAFELVDKSNLGKCSVMFLCSIIPKVGDNLFHLWSDLFLDAIAEDKVSSRDMLVQKLIPVLLKSNKSSLLTRLQERVKSRPDLKPASRLLIELSLIKASRDSSSASFDSSSLLQATGHSDSRIRLEILSLVTDCKTLSVDISDGEIEIVKSFLNSNIRIQDSGVRQQVASHLLRFLERLKRLTYAHVRDLKSKIESLKYAKTDAKKRQVETEIGNLNESVERKHSFWIWLQVFIRSNTVPGSSFPRISLTMSILQVMREIQQFQVDDGDYADKLSTLTELEKPEAIRSFVATFTHTTYEPIRSSILEFLMTIPTSLFGQETDSFANHFVLKTRTLLKSITASDADTAAMLIQFILNVFVRKEKLLIDLSLADGRYLKFAVGREPVHYFIKGILTLLKEAVIVAEQDLRQCAEQYPINGILDALHFVLSSTPMTEEYIGNLAMFQETMKELVDICFSACHAVMGICSDSSPEGQVPASFADMHTSAAGVDDDQDTTSFAQLVLRQCFRTIKGCVSVMDTLVYKALSLSLPIIPPFLISTIGDLFCTMLTSIRHRGAFASAHLHFTSLCRSIIQYGNEDIRRLPFVWLERFLQQMKSMEVSVTRRSAGLPLAILAILSNIGSSHQEVFARTMKELHMIAEDGSQFDNDEDRDETVDDIRVHAINVLRTLIQDSALSSLTRDHMGESFAVCIRLFSSPSFPIRNCAAMLFASLVGKSLGTKKAKDDFDMINTVSPREFFGKFPHLCDVFLKEFQVAVEALDRGSIHPLLYPILNVLARMKPVPVSADLGTINLEPFSKLAGKCVHSSHWKVRVMAARATACLSPASHILNVIQNCVERISQNQCNSNLIHGYLLTIRCLLVLHLRSIVERSQHDTANKIVDCLIEVGGVLKNIGYHPNMNILLELVEFLDSARILNAKLSELIEQLWGICTQYILVDMSAIVDGKPYSTVLNAPMVAQFWVKHAPADKLSPEQILHRIFCLTDLDAASAGLELFHSRLLNKLVASKAKRNVLDQCLNFLLSNSSGNIRSPSQHPDCIYYAVQILLASCTERIDFQDNVKQLQFELSRQTKLPQSFKVIEAMLQLLACMISLNLKDSRRDEDLEKLYIERMTQFLQDDAPLELRRAVLQSLSLFTKTCALSAVTEPSESFLLSILFAFDQVLTDDRDEIRYEASQLVSTWMSFDMPYGESVTRLKLIEWITNQTWQTDCLKKMFDMALSRLEFRTTLPSITLGSDKPESKLFAAEDLNIFREPLVDILLAYRLLKKAGASPNVLTSYSERLSAIIFKSRKALDVLKGSMETPQKSHHRNELVWSWNDPSFVAAMTALSCISQLQHDQELESIFISQNPDLRWILDQTHPCLTNIVNANFASLQEFYLC